MSCFPFMQNIEGALCLLAGGGEVALRKARTLASFGARLLVCARAVKEELRPLAVRVVEGYSPSLLEGVRFAVAATDNAALNARVAADCRARGIPVNSADDPDNCDFFFPALVVRGEVTVGISTGGASPALAAALRAYIEGLLPQNVGEIASRAKALRGSLPQAEYVAAVKKLLEEGGMRADQKEPEEGGAVQNVNEKAAQKVKEKAAQKAKEKAAQHVIEEKTERKGAEGEI